jgi:hypothetical protein
VLSQSFARPFYRQVAWRVAPQAHGPVAVSPTSGGLTTQTSDAVNSSYVPLKS